MNEVRARSLADSPTACLGIEVEAFTECGGQSLDVFLGQLNNHVDVQRRAGLAADTTGQRTADEIPDVTGLQGFRDYQSDTNRVGNHSSVTEDVLGLRVNPASQLASQFQDGETQKALSLRRCRMPHADPGKGQLLDGAVELGHRADLLGRRHLPPQFNLNALRFERRV